MQVRQNAIEVTMNNEIIKKSRLFPYDLPVNSLSLVTPFTFSMKKLENFLLNLTLPGGLCACAVEH
jgi:hypothetical protein